MPINVNNSKKGGTSFVNNTRPDIRNTDNSIRNVVEANTIQGLASNLQSNPFTSPLGDIVEFVSDGITEFIEDQNGVGYAEINQVTDINSSNYKSIKHYHKLFDESEIDLYNKIYRYGILSPYHELTTGREFLFFTKPDLNIFKRDSKTGTLLGGPMLNDYLDTIPYWRDLAENRSRIIRALQLSANPTDNFNHLLQNQVRSNLEIPGLSAETFDTAVNMYGVGLSYRGSSESADNGHTFSLEFKDTKWLDIYYFFKTYDEYEVLKHHGAVAPYRYYIENRILHDQFSIYKFIVDEDMETIIYWCKLYGVMPTSVPRDTFNTASFDNGISYSVDFKASFFEDMRPEILSDFNAISGPYYNTLPYQINIYNTELGRVDGRPAQAAYIEAVSSNRSPNKYVYKLRWRGSDSL